MAVGIVIYVCDAVWVSCLTSNSGIGTACDIQASVVCSGGASPAC
uniref:Uncharacterized protein n=1 Tax=Arundo donax TaxID=35708 RepID=A0A0A9H1L3_ARUDO